MYVRVMSVYGGYVCVWGLRLCMGVMSVYVRVMSVYGGYVCVWGLSLCMGVMSVYVRVMSVYGGYVCVCKSYVFVWRLCLCMGVMSVYRGYALCIRKYYHKDVGVLPGITPLVKFIQKFIRDK